MNLEDLVRDTFTDHEHLAPPENEVLSAVYAHTGARPARSRYLALAATVALVAGAATGAVVLTGRDATPAHLRHADARHSAAASSAQSPGPAPARSTAPARHIATVMMPFDLAWLPPGQIDYTARRINIGGVSDHSAPSFDGEYLLDAHVGGTTIMIDVQEVPGGLVTAAKSKCGAMQVTTVDGQRGYQSVDASGPCGYELYFRDTGGHTMYVNVARDRAAPNPAAQMSGIGRRIATHIRYPGTTTLHPPFGIGYLPNGLRVTAFDYGDLSPKSRKIDSNAMTYQIGTDDDAQQISVGLTRVRADGTSGRAVQGHLTRLSQGNSYYTLTVLSAVHGYSVSIQAKAPLSEIYKIADGLELADN